MTSNDTITGRFISDRPTTQNAASNLQFGSLFAAESATKDTNLALSHTRVLSARSSTSSASRTSAATSRSRRPTRSRRPPRITSLFTIGGLNNFPQGRIQNSFQFQDVFSWQTGRHSLKFGGDLRYLQLDNQAAFDSKGTYTFNNLQDYIEQLRVLVRPGAADRQLRRATDAAVLLRAGRFQLTPDFTLNLGLRYENSSVPLGFFGAEDQESLGALVPGPVQRDNNNWAPRVGFAWTPRPDGGLLGGLFGGEGQSVFRGGYGVGYDVLFYNILTVNASNYPRVVVPRVDNVFDVYPNLASRGRQRRVQPAGAVRQHAGGLAVPAQQLLVAVIRARALGHDKHRVRLQREPEPQWRQPAAGQSGGAHRSAGRNGSPDAQFGIDPSDPGAPRLPAVRQPGAHRDHRRRQLPFGVRELHPSPLEGPAVPRQLHVQPERVQQRRVARRGGHHRRVAADPAGLQQHRCGVESVGVRPDAPRGRHLAVRNDGGWQRLRPAADGWLADSPAPTSASPASPSRSSRAWIPTATAAAAIDPTSIRRVR